MSTNKQIVCPSCGFKNQAPLANDRCVSCGSKVEELGPAMNREGDEHRYEQDGFSLLWFAISIVISGMLTFAVVGAMPRLVTALDFEGSAGMLMAIPVWFVSGALIGMISPGKTFIEPVVATFLVAMPTAFLLFLGQTVKTMPAFMYVLMSALGVLFTLIGSYLGERFQMGTVPKKSASS